MNRASLINLEGLRPDMLPPLAARPGGDGGIGRERPHAAGATAPPVRALFLHAYELGFQTYGRMIERYTAARDDLDALHVYLAIRGLVRGLGVRGPAHSFRLGLAWRLVLGRWFAGPLPLDRFDVVHVVQQQRAWGVAAARGRGARRGNGVGGSGPKFVLNLDSTTQAWSRAFGPPKPRGLDLDSAMERRIFARADAIACWSTWVTDSLRRDYGVPGDKLTLALPAVPVPGAGEGVERRLARCAARRAAAAGARERLKIVFVGNDWQRKGGHRLLAWHQSRWREKAELHVCSRAAPRDDAAAHVVWHGATPHEKLVGEILPAMDVFVLPTRCEAMPVAIMEAHAAGLPVVASRIAGIPDSVLDGQTGSLLDVGDDAGFIAAIERLIDDPAHLEATTRAASRHGRERLDADRWHTHLLDQVVAVARGGAVRSDPWSVAAAGEPPSLGV